MTKEIQVQYDGRTGDFSIQNNNNLQSYRNWQDFQRAFIETYSGEEIEIKIYCWNIIAEEMDIIRARKSELIERIARGCKNVKKDRCDNSCPILCER